MTRRPSIGLQVHPQVVPLIILMTLIEEMLTTGKYGMEISHFLNTESISSVMHLSLDFSLSHAKRP